MPEAKKQPKTTAKLVDIDRLSQADVARLIDRPTSFVRDHEHWFERDTDGKYRGRQVVDALLKNRVASVEPMEFDDQTLEFFLQVTHHAAFDWYLRAATVRRLDGLVKQHGLAALAAFGGVVLNAIRMELASQGDEHPSQRVNDDREALEADAAEWVENELKRAREFATRRAGRTVDYCPECETYRWGRIRRRLPAPTGYIVDECVCNDCEN